MFRDFILTLIEGQNYSSLEDVLSGRVLGTFPCRYSNGDATNEKTNVGPKKYTGLQKGTVALWIGQPRVCVLV